MFSKNKKRIVKNLLQSYTKIGGINYTDGSNHPSLESIELILKLLKELLFPGFFEKNKLNSFNINNNTKNKVFDVKNNLVKEIGKSLCWLCDKKNKCSKESKKQCKLKAKKICIELLDFLPELRIILKKDIEAIYKGDPAAKSEAEIILAYPGFQAIIVFRIAHFLYKKEVPLIPRMMTEIAHSETGIDIHPGASIGSNFCIDHGTGIVIGETAEIGNNVKLYQGVTIGALSISDRNCNIKRHPTIKDNVIIYAKTTILGGNTIIGKNSIIGGNTWITSSIPPNSKIYFTPENQLFLKTE